MFLFYPWSKKKNLGRWQWLWPNGHYMSCIQKYKSHHLQVNTARELHSHYTVLLTVEHSHCHSLNLPSFFHFLDTCGAKREPWYCWCFVEICASQLKHFPFLCQIVGIDKSCDQSGLSTTKVMIFVVWDCRDSVHHKKVWDSVYVKTYLTMCFLNRNIFNPWYFCGDISQI